MTPARARLVSIARSMADVGAASAATRYAALVATGETRARSADMIRMYGCALVVRGLWRRAGIRHPILARPYRTGMAVFDVLGIAREAGAVRPPRTAPAPGDAILVGGPREEHVYTVLRPYAEDWPTGGLWFEALDGGQRDAAGAQVMRLVEHELLGEPPRDGTRLVRHVIDYDAIWARFGASVA